MDDSPQTSGHSSPDAASATSKNNPFTIEYILSSAAAAVSKQNQQMQSPLPIDQLNLMNHQRAQLMAVAATAAAAAQSSDPNLQQTGNQTATPTSPAMQQSHQLMIDQQANPNFLYLMACMLVQQQQHQHEQQQQRQINLHQQQQRQLQQQQQQTSLALGSNQQLARQPMNLTRSPMDNLALLASLANQSFIPQNGFGKQSRPNFSQQSIRPQPYVGRSNHSAAQPPPLHHPVSRNSRLPSLDLLNHHFGNQNHLLPQSSQPSRTSSLVSQKFNGVNLVPDKFRNLCGNGSGPSSSHSQLFSRPNAGLAYDDHNKNRSDTSTGSSDNGFQGSGEKLDSSKPVHSYIGLIAMCILSSPEKRMVLNDIYQFILENYPYYQNRGSGWRNSVRHNLSLNECFQKAGRAANGKGHYWTIHPANMTDFMVGDFRRRRAQRKVRRWNNMDVPSDESDDESMEDAAKPPLPEHFKRSLEMHRRLEMSYQKSAAEAAAFVAAQVGSSCLSSLAQTAQPMIRTSIPSMSPAVVPATGSTGCPPMYSRKQGLH